MVKTTNIYKTYNTCLGGLLSLAKKTAKTADLVLLNIQLNNIFAEVDNFCMTLQLPKNIANQIIGEISRQIMEEIN